MKYKEDVELLATIGGQVQRMRTAAGLTQASLAKRADVQQSVISQLENGNIPRLPVHLLRLIARICGFHMEVVFSDQQK